MSGSSRVRSDDEHRDGAGHVAGLEPVEPHRRRALGVAHDQLVAVAVERARGEDREQPLAALDVADLHGGGEARHHRHDELPLGERGGAGLAVAEAAHHLEALVDVAGQHQRAAEHGGRLRVPEVVVDVVEQLAGLHGAARSRSACDRSRAAPSRPGPASCRAPSGRRRADRRRGRPRPSRRPRRRGPAGSASRPAGRWPSRARPGRRSPRRWRPPCAAAPQPPRPGRRRTRTTPGSGGPRPRPGDRRAPRSRARACSSSSVAAAYSWRNSAAKPRRRSTSASPDASPRRAKTCARLLEGVLGGRPRRLLLLDVGEHEEGLPEVGAPLVASLSALLDGGEGVGPSRSDVAEARQGPSAAGEEGAVARAVRRRPAGGAPRRRGARRRQGCRPGWRGRPPARATRAPVRRGRRGGPSTWPELVDELGGAHVVVGDPVDDGVALDVLVQPPSTRRCPGASGLDRPW